ncbi:MAG: divergent PAP2 family protein [Prochloraceae cyanobacterium]
MEQLPTIFDNKILLVALSACLIAQGFKLAIELLKHGKVKLSYLFTTGGMPSAHSALVGALACGIGQTLGWSSPEFAIACLFAVIVMYDAAGVRQAAGKQAKILNQLIDELFHDRDLNEERLKELLGHTPFQVLVGLLLGVSVSLMILPAFE